MQGLSATSYPGGPGTPAVEGLGALPPHYPSGQFGGPAALGAQYGVGGVPSAPTAPAPQLTYAPSDEIKSPEIKSPTTTPAAEKEGNWFDGVARFFGAKPEQAHDPPPR